MVQRLISNNHRWIDIQSYHIDQIEFFNSGIFVEEGRQNIRITTNTMYGSRADNKEIDKYLHENERY